MTLLIKRIRTLNLLTETLQTYIILYVNPTKLSSNQIYQPYTNSTSDEKRNSPQCSQ